MKNTWIIKRDSEKLSMVGMLAGRSDGFIEDFEDIFEVFCSFVR